jgi:hypothetical protein
MAERASFYPVVIELWPHRCPFPLTALQERLQAHQRAAPPPEVLEERMRRAERARAEALARKVSSSTRQK